jgi:threonine aldolase
MARRLADRVTAIDGVDVVYPVEANGVFAALPPHAIAPLQAFRRFYVWDEGASIVRWMCSWDTTEDDIDGFADAVAREVR